MSKSVVPHTLAFMTLSKLNDWPTLVRRYLQGKSFPPG
jgi:hypothetical protein